MLLQLPLDVSDLVAAVLPRVREEEVEALRILGLGQEDERAVVEPEDLLVLRRNDVGMEEPGPCHESAADDCNEAVRQRVAVISLQPHLQPRIVGEALHLGVPGVDLEQDRKEDDGSHEPVAQLRVPVLLRCEVWLLGRKQRAEREREHQAQHQLHQRALRHEHGKSC